MTHFEALPAWAAIPAAILVLGGAALTLIGAVGLWRLPSFYDRLHAPTLGTSWGTAGIVLASILMFSVGGGRAVIHEVMIAVFIMITTPVTLMLLGRAALHRDRVEGNVPFQFTREGEAEAKAAQQLAQAEARANIISAQEASLAAEAGLADAGSAEAIAAPDLPATLSEDIAEAAPELFPEPPLAAPADPVPVDTAPTPTAETADRPAAAVQADEVAENPTGAPQQDSDAAEKKPELPEY